MEQVGRKCLDATVFGLTFRGSDTEGVAVGS